MNQGPARIGVPCGGADASAFPGQDLPLTVLEEVLYWLDRPSYPVACFARLTLSRLPDRAAMEAAARVVVRRHPLLRARVVERRGGRPAWRVLDEAAPDLRWLDRPGGGSYPALSPPDPRREPGCRFLVVPGEPGPGCDLVVQWHHLCGDGLAVARVIHELLVAYDRAASGARGEPDLPPLDPEALRRRGGLTAGWLLRLLPGQAVGLKGAAQFLFRSPVPIVPHVPAPATDPLPPGYPAVETTTLDGPATRGYRRRAVASGVSLHELLTRDVFLALRRWGRQAGHLDDDRWLRLMVPVSLRGAEDRLVPAANQVSAVFLDRRGRDMEDARGLLRGIHDELDQIRRHRLRYTFLLASALARSWPGGLRRQAGSDRCRVSALLTNLGKLFQGSALAGPDGRLVAGGTRVEEVEFVAPFQPHVCAAFCAYVYAGRLRLTLHRDPRPLPAGDGAALLAACRERLLSPAGDAIPSPPGKEQDLATE